MDWSSSCKRCGKGLKDEKSILLGYGPTCYEKHKEEIKEFYRNQLTLFDLPENVKVEVMCDSCCELTNGDYIELVDQIYCNNCFTKETTYYNREGELIGSNEEVKERVTRSGL